MDDTQNALPFYPDNLGPIPKTVYKYRTWKNSFHRRIITNNELWFSHPFDLNDVFDLRPPNNIITEKLTSYEAYRHLGHILKQQMPGAPNSVIIAELNFRFKQIKQNPVDYFLQGISVTEKNKDDYNIFGVLSFSMNPLQKLLWAMYADNYRGFCIGYDTGSLTNELRCLDGRVFYSNEPVDYNPMKERSGEEVASGFFRKSLDWKYEEEYRFLTARITNETERSKSITIGTVKEIILGMNMTKEDQDSILIEIRQSHKEHVPIYKIRNRIGTFDLEKELY